MLSVSYFLIESNDLIPETIPVASNVSTNNSDDTYNMMKTVMDDPKNRLYQGEDLIPSPEQYSIRSGMSNLTDTFPENDQVEQIRNLNRFMGTRIQPEQMVKHMDENPNDPVTLLMKHNITQQKDNFDLWKDLQNKAVEKANRIAPGLYDKSIIDGNFGRQWNMNPGLSLNIKHGIT